MIQDDPSKKHEGSGSPIRKSFTMDKDEAGMGKAKTKTRQITKEENKKDSADKTGDKRGNAPLLSRRNFLIATGVGTGALFFYFRAGRAENTPDLLVRNTERHFNSFLKIGTDGIVTIAVPQSEMGQGVYTLLPQILADELGADWRTIAVTPAPIHPFYANKGIVSEWKGTPLFQQEEEAGLIHHVKEAFSHFLSAPISSNLVSIAPNQAITGAGNSLSAYGDAFRMAGATARIMLCKAAAQKWGVKGEDCHAYNGFVHFEGKEISFAELIENADFGSPPDNIALLSPDENDKNRLTGRDLPRLDLPAKVDGSINYAADIRIPDMVFAAIRQGPIGGSRVKAFDAAAVQDDPAILKIIDHDDWIAVAATNWWAANTALDRIDPIYSTSGSRANSEDFENLLIDRLKEDDGKLFLNINDAEAHITNQTASGGEIIEREIIALPSLPLPAETRAATAHIIDDKLHLWLATQAPETAIKVAAKAIQFNPHNILLYPMQAGGSFGRNLDQQIAAQIAILAKELGRPVQLCWSREEDMMQHAVRAPSAARLRLNLDPSGRITNWTMALASPASGHQTHAIALSGDHPAIAMANAKDKYDPSTLLGARPPYAFDKIALKHKPVDFPLPCAEHRARSYTHNIFFIEAVMDEMAHHMRVEPLSFRIQYLGQNVRLARCLKQVAKVANWDGGHEQSGMGIACAQIGEARIAVIAQVERDQAYWRVSQFYAVADLGHIINPDLARQQIEGAMMMGLADALGTSPKYEAGVLQTNRLSDYGLPLVAHSPQITIEFIRNKEKSADYEEIGMPAIAPALMGAIRSATGVGLLQLPLLSATV